MTEDFSSTPNEEKGRGNILLPAYIEVEARRCADLVYHGHFLDADRQRRQGDESKAGRQRKQQPPGHALAPFLRIDAPRRGPPLQGGCLGRGSPLL